MENDFDDVLFVNDADGKHLGCDCERHASFLCEPYGNGYLYECQCGQTYYSDLHHTEMGVDNAQDMASDEGDDLDMDDC